MKIGKVVRKTGDVREHLLLHTFFSKVSLAQESASLRVTTLEVEREGNNQFSQRENICLGLHTELTERPKI